VSRVLRIFGGPLPGCGLSVGYVRYGVAFLSATQSGECVCIYISMVFVIVIWGVDLVEDK